MTTALLPPTHTRTRDAGARCFLGLRRFAEVSGSATRWPEPTIVCADSVNMCRVHRVANAGLWLRISRSELAEPDYWVDDKPGWLTR